MLMALMLAFGPREAVPIMAIGAPTANFSRVAVWSRAIGYLKGTVASTGPINTPFDLAYGLIKGAHLSTEALGSFCIGLSKAIVFQCFMFQCFKAQPSDTLVRGLIVGATLMAGSRLAKGFVLRLDARRFRTLLDCLLAGAERVLLWGALVVDDRETRNGQ
jgi:uncharacterized protein